MNLLIDDLVRRSIVDCAGDVSAIRSKDQFEALCRRVRSEIGNSCLKTAGLLNGILPLFGRISLLVYGELEARRPLVFDDLSSQLEDLVYPGFLVELEPQRLEHYPRYLKDNRRETGSVGPESGAGQSAHGEGPAMVAVIIGMVWKKAACTMKQWMTTDGYWKNSVYRCLPSASERRSGCLKNAWPMHGRKPDVDTLSVP